MFRSHNTAILLPYKIEMTNAAAAFAPSEVSWKIYATAQEGVTTAFLQ